MYNIVTVRVYLEASVLGTVIRTLLILPNSLNSPVR